MLKAVIFDLDGTILDNEDIYGKAFTKVLSTLGIKCAGPRPHLGGVGVKANWEFFLKGCDKTPIKSIDELAKETQEVYASLLSEVKVRGGFEDFAKELIAKNIKLALATSNSRAVTEKVLNLFNLKHFFKVIVTEEDVAMLKPDPEIFLQTARRLNEDPERCVVVEDSEAGVKAASSANMRVVAIKSNSDEIGSIDLTSLVVQSFKELSYEKLMSLFS